MPGSGSVCLPPFRSHTDVLENAPAHWHIDYQVHVKDQAGSPGNETAKPPALTGLLVDAMTEILEADHAEQWMSHFTVEDDPPQSTKGRLGKKRPRIDIVMVECGRPGTRPRLLIEAKRLYRSDSVTQYFGPSGLGMFLDGNYAPEQPHAGMLAYVQTKDVDHWRAAVESGFHAKRSSLAACAQAPQMVLADPVPDRHSPLSAHLRSNLSKILIYHLFLDCR